MNASDFPRLFAVVRYASFSGCRAVTVNQLASLPAGLFESLSDLTSL